MDDGVKAVCGVDDGGEALCGVDDDGEAVCGVDDGREALCGVDDPPACMHGTTSHMVRGPAHREWQERSASSWGNRMAASRIASCASHRR